MGQISTMKAYDLEDLLRSPPIGSTHINYGVYSYNYIKHDSKGHQIWLGKKHGGWSFKLNHEHPHYKKLICIPMEQMVKKLYDRCIAWENQCADGIDNGEGFFGHIDPAYFTAEKQNNTDLIGEIDQWNIT